MASISSYASSAGDYVFSTKGIVSFFGKVAIGAMCYFAARTGYTWLEVKKFELPKLAVSGPTAPVNEHADHPIDYYSIIKTRNIFVLEKKDAGPVASPTVPLTLRLVATHAAKGDAAFAIIENTKKNSQDIFDLTKNSNVFDQGTLIAISEGSIKISHNNKEDTIYIEEAKSGGKSTVPGAPPSDDQRDFSISEAELSEQMANLPRLLSEARAVPYFRNGVSVGMRLFAIRRESLYEKLGLKNGDIVKAVNNSSLADPAEALKIFEQLKSERDISVVVERNGEEISLHYRIQ